MITSKRTAAEVLFHQDNDWTEQGFAGDGGRSALSDSDSCTNQMPLDSGHFWSEDSDESDVEMSECYMMSPTILTGTQTLRAVTARGLQVGSLRAIDFIAEAHFYLEVLCSSLCRRSPSGWTQLKVNEGASRDGQEHLITSSRPSCLQSCSSSTDEEPAWTLQEHYEFLSSMRLLGSQWRQRAAETLGSRSELSQLRYAVKYLLELVEFLAMFHIEATQEIHEIFADDVRYFIGFDGQGRPFSFSMQVPFDVARQSPSRSCTFTSESLPGYEEWVSSKEDGSLQFEVISDDSGRFKFGFCYSSDTDPLATKHLEGSVTALARALGALEEPDEHCAQIVFSIGSSEEFRVPQDLTQQEAEYLGMLVEQLAPHKKSLVKSLKAASQSRSISTEQSAFIGKVGLIKAYYLRELVIANENGLDHLCQELPSESFLEPLFPLGSPFGLVTQPTMPADPWSSSQNPGKQAHMQLQNIAYPPNIQEFGGQSSPLAGQQNEQNLMHQQPKDFHPQPQPQPVDFFSNTTLPWQQAGVSNEQSQASSVQYFITVNNYTFGSHQSATQAKEPSALN